MPQTDNYKTTVSSATRRTSKEKGQDSLDGLLHEDDMPHLLKYPSNSETGITGVQSPLSHPHIILPGPLLHSLPRHRKLSTAHSTNMLGHLAPADVEQLHVYFRQVGSFILLAYICLSRVERVERGRTTRFPETAQVGVSSPLDCLDLQGREDLDCLTALEVIVPLLVGTVDECHHLWQGVVVVYDEGEVHHGFTAYVLGCAEGISFITIHRVDKWSPPGYHVSMAGNTDASTVFV